MVCVRQSFTKITLPLVTLMIAGFTYTGQAKVTLKFAFWGDNATEAKLNIDILKRFTKNTGIEVTPVLTSYSTHNEKIITMATAGTAPDLFWLQYVTSVPQFADSKIATNLDPYIKKDKSFNSTDLFSTALKIGQYKGTQYSLLRDICDWVFTYNKELLDKAGLTPPKPTWTLDDFISVYGKRLTLDSNGDGKPEQYACASYNWDTAIYQFGGELWERDGKRSRVTEPPVISALQWYVDLANKHKVTQTPNGWGDIATKKFAFGLSGPWNWGPYSKTLKFKWDIINLPVGPTGKSVSQLLGEPICMYSRTKHPKEAYQLLKFLCTDPEAQMMQATLGIAMPTLKKLAYSDTFAKAAATPDGIKYYLDSLEDTYIQPQFTREPQAKEMLTSALAPLWAGKKTPEQVMKSIKPSLDAFLGRK